MMRKHDLTKEETLIGITIKIKAETKNFREHNPDSKINPRE